MISMELVCLYLIPVLTSLLYVYPLKPSWLGRIQIISSTALFVVITQIIQSISQLGPQFFAERLIYIDALSALFMLLIGLIGVFTAIYSMKYMLNEEEEKLRNPWKLRIFYILFNLFILSMLCMVTVNSLGVYWVAIEASTLFSAFLVGYYSQKKPIEAAWKYIILCTVGIAFALIGLILTYYAVQKTHGDISQGLDWVYLLSIANRLDPNLIKASFIFILIGFGTKAGLAPMHNWLPDSYSEAPTPASALLSGILSKCALYGIIRYSILSGLVLGKGFSQQFLLFFGLFSLAIAVPFILLQKNIKRLLAYSSIEHIGIIATGLGFGTPIAVFGALFHMFNHALAKSILFFTAGNLSLKFHTKEIPQIQSAIKFMPITGTLLLITGLALAGMPPFSVFMSEFYIAWGGFTSQAWIQSLLFIFLLVIVFGGFSYQLIQMTVGPSPLPTETTKAIPMGEMNRSGLIAVILPFLLLLIFTWWLPGPLVTLLHQAVTIVTGETFS